MSIFVHARKRFAALLTVLTVGAVAISGVSPAMAVESPQPLAAQATTTVFNAPGSVTSPASGTEIPLDVRVIAADGSTLTLREGDTFEWSAKITNETIGERTITGTYSAGPGGAITHKISHFQGNYPSDTVWSISVRYAGNPGLPTYQESAFPARQSVRTAVASLPVTATATFAKNALDYGQDTTATVTVKRNDNGDQSYVGGTAQLYDTVTNKPVGGKIAVANGIAVVPVKSSDLGVGANRPLTVRFRTGGAVPDAETSPQSMTVLAVSNVTVATPCATRPYGEACTVAAQVRSAQVPANAINGTLKAYEGSDRSKELGSATVTNGDATLTLPSDLALGTHNVQLVFGGVPNAVTPATYAMPGFSVGRANGTGTLGLSSTTPRQGATLSVTMTFSSSSVPSDKINNGTVVLRDSLGAEVGRTTSIANGVALLSVVVPSGTNGAFLRPGPNVLRAMLTGSSHLQDTTTADVAVTVAGVFDSKSAPTISAPQGVRTGQTVSAFVNPAWSPGTGFDYQWFVNGEPILDAEGRSISYAIKQADAGKSLQVRVTSTLAGYEPTSQISQPAVISGIFTSTPTPEIVGQIKTGRTVTVNAGAWKPDGAKLSYQWFLDGREIDGANTADYAIKPADARKPLSVRVTGEMASYDPVAMTSASSRVVGVFQETPLPSISSSSGVVQVGAKLTATVADSNPKQATTTYEWFSSASTTIPIGTGATYVVKPADLDATIRVVATSNLDGYDPGVQSSANTAQVARGVFAEKPVGINGTVKIGNTVFASTTGWSVAPVEPSYQWYISSVQGGSRTLIPGAQGTGYTPVESDFNKWLSVSVTTTKTPGYEEVTSFSSETRVVKSFFSSTNAPGISAPDGVKTGKTVTAIDPNWTPKPGFSYEWIVNGERVSNESSYVPKQSEAGKSLQLKVTSTDVDYEIVSRSSNTADIIGQFTSMPIPEVTAPDGVKVGKTVSVSDPRWEPATGFTYSWTVDGMEVATGTSYKLKPLDAKLPLSVTVKSTRGEYESISRSSAPVNVIGVFDSMRVPMIEGVAQAGRSLKAVMEGDWSPKQDSFTYEWFRGAGTTPIGSGIDYVPVGADVGQVLRLEVTGKKDGYQQETRSAQTGTVIEGDYSETPVTITGKTQSGQPVQADLSGWRPVVPTGAQVTYQWKIAGFAVDGQTGKAYNISAGDIGKMLSVEVTASVPGYRKAVVTSPGVLVTEKPVFTDFPAPSFNAPDGVKVGKTVTANVPAWTPETGFSYQWTLDGKDIRGATQRSYTIAPEDAKGMLRVVVTSTNGSFEQKSVASEGETVLGVIASAVPTISGTVKVGSTVTATPGVWSPGNVAISYEWFLNGASAGTGASFKIPASAGGKALSVKATARLAGYESASQESARRTVAAAPVVVLLTKAPTISGKLTVGKTVKVKLSGRAAGTAVKYQWLSNGKAIKKATKSSLRITSALKGKKLSIRVTVSKSGAPTVVKTSKAAKIKK